VYLRLHLTAHRCRRREYYRTAKMAISQGVTVKRHADDETSSLIHTRGLSSSSETPNLLDNSNSGNYDNLLASYGVYSIATADLEVEQRQVQDRQQKGALSLPNKSASATIRQLIMVLLIGEPNACRLSTLAIDREKVYSPLMPTDLSCSQHIRSSRPSSTFWAIRVGSLSASHSLVPALRRW
jgi:hypothetical protein